DDRGERERDLQPERVERRPEESGAPERREEPDPSDRGRQHERQLHDGDEAGAAGEAPRREEVRERRSEEQDQRFGNRRRPEADHESVQDDAVREQPDEAARRNPREDRHHRQREEEQRNGACGEEHCSLERTFHRRKKPYDRRMRWPALPSTRLTTARAAGLCELAETTQMP